MTLEQLYEGGFPDDNELIWSHVGPGDFSVLFKIVVVNPVEIWQTHKPNGDTLMRDAFVEFASRDQKRIVAAYRKKAVRIATADPIVVDDGDPVDGFHRIAAMAMEGITQALAVDLAQEV